jgi:hypothetical protein
VLSGGAQASPEYPKIDLRDSRISVLSRIHCGKDQRDPQVKFGMSATRGPGLLRQDPVGSSAQKLEKPGGALFVKRKRPGGYFRLFCMKPVGDELRGSSVVDGDVVGKIEGNGGGWLAEGLADDIAANGS